EQGASALGFIFAESHRRISREALESFRHAIPPQILCVGVFRGQTSEEIDEAMRNFSLDIAQIYDSAKTDFPVWHANTISTPDQINNLNKNGVSKILWDVKANEDELERMWRLLSTQSIFALAGGLNSTNVKRAVDLCKPAWVDVARGVEKSP